jgi:hypothetical protein
MAEAEARAVAKEEQAERDRAARAVGYDPGGRRRGWRCWKNKAFCRARSVTAMRSPAGSCSRPWKAADATCPTASQGQIGTTPGGPVGDSKASTSALPAAYLQRNVGTRP